MSEDIQEFFVGDYVEKIVGDYRFVGHIKSAFQKASGKWRYVVENEDQVLHIFSGKQLTHKSE